MCLSRRFSWQSVPSPSRPGTADCFWYVCRHTRCLHTCLLEDSSQTPLSSYQWAAPRDYQRLSDAFVKKAPRKGSIRLASCSPAGTMLNKCPKQPNKEGGAHSRIKGVHKGSYNRWTSSLVASKNQKPDSSFSYATAFGAAQMATC